MISKTLELKPSVTSAQKINRYFVLLKYLLFSAGKSKTPEQVWEQIQQLFADYEFEENWRNYEYLRLHFLFIEIVLIFFREKSYTSPHDHFDLNFNKAVCGSFWESNFTVRNGKARRIKETRIPQGSMSVCLPFAVHEMRIDSPCVAFNIHIPGRQNLKFEEVSSVSLSK